MSAIIDCSTSGRPLPATGAQSVRVQE